MESPKDTVVPTTAIGSSRTVISVGQNAQDVINSSTLHMEDRPDSIETVTVGKGPERQLSRGSDDEADSANDSDDDDADDDADDDVEEDEGDDSYSDDGDEVDDDNDDGPVNDTAQPFMWNPRAAPVKPVKGVTTRPTKPTQGTKGSGK